MGANSWLGAYSNKYGTGEKKVPELEFETIDTVEHRSSSDWNLRIYLPQVKASTV